MKAYHNDKSVKKKYIDRVKAHQLADEFTQGTYWQDGKGCGVGCTVHSNRNPHERYPAELGLPVWLAHLEDHIFEALSPDESKAWPLALLEAIPVGAEVTDRLRDRFQVFWLERQKTQID